MMERIHIKCDNCGHEWEAKYYEKKVYYQCSICHHFIRLKQLPEVKDGNRAV